MPQVSVTYFDKAGPENTDQTLEIALRRAQELGIETVLVATTQGDTGVKAASRFKGYRVIVVSHSTGFVSLNHQELTPENQARIEAEGGIILTCQHTFAGLGRAVRRKYGTYELEDIVANVLRILGQGMKVVCEMATMAADAGLVRTDQDIIAIAGTARGADTAVVMRAANAQDFFDLKVKEVLCKPRL